MKPHMDGWIGLGRKLLGSWRQDENKLIKPDTPWGTGMTGIRRRWLREDQLDVTVPFITSPQKKMPNRATNGCYLGDFLGNLMCFQVSRFSIYFGPARLMNNWLHGSLKGSQTHHCAEGDSRGVLRRRLQSQRLPQMELQLGRPEVIYVKISGNSTPFLSGWEHHFSTSFPRFNGRFLNEFLHVIERFLFGSLASNTAAVEDDLLVAQTRTNW